MHIVDTCRDADGQGWLVVRHTSNDPVTLACVLLDKLYCDHSPGSYRCLIDPPRWAYWIGGHYRFSLGGLMWKVGQMTTARIANTPVIYQSPLSDLELRGLFDWPAHIFEELDD